MFMGTPLQLKLKSENLKMADLFETETENILHF